MKSIVEYQCCAMRAEKKQEPAHETESTSLPGSALSDSPVEHGVRGPTPVRREPVSSLGRCYEHRQDIAQSERTSGASHTPAVCERGG